MVCAIFGYTHQVHFCASVPLVFCENIQTHPINKKNAKSSKENNAKSNLPLKKKYVTNPSPVPKIRS